MNDEIKGQISTASDLANFDPVVNDLSAFTRQLSTTLTEKEVIALQNIIHNTDSLINETIKSLTISNEVNQIITNIENFSNEDFENSKVIRGKEPYDFYNLFHGPISDSLYHIGQVVAFRRASGNPIPRGVNHFLGIKM